MLEICKRHAYTTGGRVRLGICISTIFIAAMVFGLLIMAKPYAVYANGEKVSDPWVVKVNGQEVVVVESEEAGKAVVAGVKSTYIKSDLAKVETTDVGKNVVIEKYQFDDNSKHPVVMTAPEAVAHISKLNESGAATPIAVENKTIVEDTVSVPYTTETVESDQYYVGRSSVQVAGVEGQNKVVSEVTLVNGKEVSRKEISVTVITAPVNEVVYTGTYPVPTAATTTTSSSSSSSGRTVSYNVPASRNGQAVADFACQFAGNPYVYGGTSLTNGADCSGFTMAVYANFGVSLPRSSYSQGSVGVTVPASEAMPGDLVCYGGHVGIYIGGGMMIHASTPSGGIRIGSVDYASHWFQRVL